MPNIFKSFLKPAATAYVFPAAEDLQVGEAEPAEELPAEPAEEVPAEPAAEPAVPEEPSREQAVIDYAQIQAREILEDARRRAEELVEERRQAAETEIQAQLESAREEGFRQGYGEGLTKAQIEGAAQLAEQKTQETLEIQKFLEQASAAREQLLAQTREELRDLSLAVAEKVIHVSLKSSSEVIARMIQVATEKLKRREWGRIYVAGCEAKTLAQITPELMSSLASVSDHVKIIPMSDDEAGTCIIEMPDEIIDASVSTQLSNIRELLNEG